MTRDSMKERGRSITRSQMAYAADELERVARWLAKFDEDTAGLWTPQEVYLRIARRARLLRKASI